MLYDFGSKLNPRFWGNVRRLIGLVGEGSLVRARHYGAHVMLFRGEEIPY